MNVILLLLGNSVINVESHESLMPSAQGSDDEEDGKAPLPPDNPMPPPLPPTPDQVIIRKDYDPKGERDFIIRT